MCSGETPLGARDSFSALAYRKCATPLSPNLAAGCRTCFREPSYQSMPRSSWMNSHVIVAQTLQTKSVEVSCLRKESDPDKQKQNTVCIATRRNMRLRKKNRARIDFTLLGFKGSWQQFRKPKPEMSKFGQSKCGNRNLQNQRLEN